MRYETKDLEHRLVSFALCVLAEMESQEDWGSDLCQDLGDQAQLHELMDEAETTDRYRNSAAVKQMISSRHSRWVPIT